MSWWCVLCWRGGGEASPNLQSCSGAVDSSCRKTWAAWGECVTAGRKEKLRALLQAWLLPSKGSGLPFRFVTRAWAFPWY